MGDEGCSLQTHTHPGTQVDFYVQRVSISGSCLAAAPGAGEGGSPSTGAAAETAAWCWQCHRVFPSTCFYIFFLLLDRLSPAHNNPILHGQRG